MEDVGDDFGDLYADVAIQASSAIIGAPDFVRLYGDDTNKAEDFASDSGSKELDSGDADSSRKSENEESNMMDFGSDSEDDFNIVLNDEEGQRFPVRSAVGAVGGSDGDDGDRMEQGFAGGDRGNGGKGGYHSQFSQYKVPSTAVLSYQ